jgi:hypothetical protein
MAKTKNEDTEVVSEQMVCPVGRLFLKLEKAARRKSKVTEHLFRSQAEFLKAIKYLIDERIEDLEKWPESKAKKKATHIKVE